MKKLPSDQDLKVPVTGALLDLNARLAEAVRLCIAIDTVLDMAHRRLPDVPGKDAGDDIEAVMALAGGLSPQI